MEGLASFIFVVCTLALVRGHDDLQSLRDEISEIRFHTRRIMNQNEKLKEELGATRSELSAMKKSMNNGSVVGFFARPDGNLDVSAGTNIVYTEVISNYGDAYSANSGFFIAPVNGIYTFTTYMQTVDGADTAISLQRGNVQQCFIETIPETWGAASCTVVLDLDAGEEIYIRGFSNGRVRGDPDGASGFSGHLISETL